MWVIRKQFFGLAYLANIEVGTQYFGVVFQWWQILEAIKYIGGLRQMHVTGNMFALMDVVINDDYITQNIFIKF